MIRERILSSKELVYTIIYEDLGWVIVQESEEAYKHDMVRVTVIAQREDGKYFKLDYVRSYSNGVAHEYNSTYITEVFPKSVETVVYE